MKSYTKEEIEAKAREVWPKAGEWLGGSHYNPTGIMVNILEDGKVHIEIGDMYEAPGFSFAQLMTLAEFFETDNIVDIDRSFSGGCETCDYGSYGSFTLEVQPGNWPIKSQS